MGGVLCRHIITIFYIINKSYCKVDHTDLAKIKQLTQDVLIQMNKAVMKESGIHVQFQGDRESAILLSQVNKKDTCAKKPDFIRLFCYRNHENFRAFFVDALSSLSAKRLNLRTAEGIP